MNKHTKPQAASTQPRAKMEMLMREINTLKLNERTLTMGMDAELQSVRDRYENRIGLLAETLTEKMTAACAWAEAHAAEFGPRKSIKFVHGTAGFRTGPPKLKTVSRIKWEDVLRSLRSFRWGRAYLRVKQEINKEQIIADVAARLLDEGRLRKAGARIVQEQTFFVEPKLTSGKHRKTAKAKKQNRGLSVSA